MFPAILFATCAMAAGIENPAARPATPSAVAAALDVNRDGTIDTNEIGKQSLFNLKADISETKDELAKQPEIANQLSAKLAALKQGLPAAPARRTF